MPQSPWAWQDAHAGSAIISTVVISGVISTTLPLCLMVSFAIC